MSAERVPAGGHADVDARRPDDECGQRLSCLIDGEVDADECRALVERLRQDEGACRRWALLNCVGDAMRSPEVAAWHCEGFVARVSAALESEPTVLAPAALAPRHGLRRWLWPGAGAAVAAAVLLAVSLPARQADAPELVARPAPTMVAQPAPTTVVAQPAATPPAQAFPAVERSPVLERYLAAHRELAAPQLMPNSTPYVRTSSAIFAPEPR